MQPQSHRIHLPLLTPIDYLTSGQLKQAERVYLLLHGFNERAKNAVRRWQNALPEDACFIAPDGPYPLPEKRDGHWRIGHAWYFYDSFKEEYFITPVVSAQVLASLVTDLCPQAKISVLGFSQGAYLAPYVPHEIKACDQVIMMNGLVRSDMVERVENVEYEIFNSDKDPLVDFQKSESHSEIFSRGSELVKFHKIESDSHDVTEEHMQLLRRILK